MQVDFAKYRKFVVAGTGAALLVASQIAGLTIAEGTADDILHLFDAAVAVATALGVRQVPNTQ